MKILFIDYDEIGGFMKNYCIALNGGSRVKAAYLSFGDDAGGHNSNNFHYRNSLQNWDYSKYFGSDTHTGSLDFCDEKSGYLQKVIEEFAPDVVVASGKAAAVAEYSGVEYRYITFGYDIFQYAYNINAYHDKKFKHEFVYEYLHNNESSLVLNFQDMDDNIFIGCIKGASGIMITPYALKYLEGITDSTKLFYIPHCVSLPEKTHSDHNPDKLKFLCSARHIWDENSVGVIDNKRIDIVIDTVFEFSRKYRKKDTILYLFEKGPDVDKTKAYISSKGLDDSVEWLPEMPRNELFAYYESADFIFGQFGSPVLEYTAVEPLALGKPVASWLGSSDSEMYKRVPFYKEFPPVINSKDPKEIAEVFLEIALDSDKYNKISRQSLEWFNKFCSLSQLEDSFINLKTFEGFNIKDFVSSKRETLKSDRIAVDVFKQLSELDEKLDMVSRHSKKVAELMLGDYSKEKFHLSVDDIKKEDGYCYTAKLSEKIASIVNSAEDHYMLIYFGKETILFYEDNHYKIRRYGDGRYCLWGDMVYLSVPGNADLFKENCKVTCVLLYK
jgi:glycosyltransferase involved in cell wall biosynthesis